MVFGWVVIYHGQRFTMHSVINLLQQLRVHDGAMCLGEGVP